MAPFRTTRPKPASHPGPVIEPPPTQNPGVHHGPQRKTKPVKDPFKAVVLTKEGKVTEEGKKIL